MATEYKLSYTGQEINEKLDKIPEGEIATVEQVNDKADANHNHDDIYETKTDASSKLDEAKQYANTLIDGLDNAIIDVLELPSENINEEVFYRIISGKFVHGDIGINEEWICCCVDGLPENPEPASKDFVNIFAYYNIQDGLTYGYVDSNISSAAGGIPIGWYTLEQLAPAFGMTFGGVIDHIDKIKQGEDIWYVLLTKENFYIYDNGWKELPYGYISKSEINITWNGVIGDKYVVDMSTDNSKLLMVKMTDEIFTENQILGGEFTLNDGSARTVSNIDTSITGCIGFEYGIIVYSAEEVNTATGMSFVNGTYFMYEEGTYYDGENNLVTFILYPTSFIGKSYIKKINNDFINMEEISEIAYSEVMHDISLVGRTGDYNDLTNKPLLATVATTGDYDNLLNKPYIGDVVRYNEQTFPNTYKKQARQNIDAISSIEVDEILVDYAKTTEVDEKLVDYAKTTEVDKKLGYFKISMPKKGNWNSIAYGNGKFIAVGNSGMAASLTNGYTWELVNNLAYINASIIYNNNKFVLLCNGIIYSYDGINWENCIYPDIDFSKCKSITYGNGVFIIACNTGEYLYSTDGINWNKYSLDTQLYSQKIYYCNDRFISAGSSNTNIYTNLINISIDGINWEEYSFPYNGMRCSHICYGNDKIIMFVSNGNLSTDKMFYSDDGINWSESNLPFASFFNALLYADNKFIAVSNSKIIYSYDGINWENCIYPYYDTIQYYNSCAYNYTDGIFVISSGIAGNIRDSILISTNGINWTNDVLLQSYADVTSDVAQVIQPYLSLTASDVGALPSDTIIPSIEGLATETYVDQVATQAATTVKNELLNGAGEAYDTLQELSTLIDENTNALEALETVANGKADKEHTHDQYLTEIPSEYVTETELSAKGYAKQTDVDNLSDEIDDQGNKIENHQTQLDNKQPKGEYVKSVNGVTPDVSGNVKVEVQAEQIPFVDSIEEMTDTSRVYCLTTDGFIYKYQTKTEITQHTGENKFKPSEATINKRMGSSSLSAQNGYVWTGAIPVDLTKESPFRVKVEGTKITEPTTAEAFQKLWLCADTTGTTKLSAAVLVLGDTSSNYATLLEDGTIYADYKGNAKLSDSIITGTKYLRIGFKFSDSAIGSTSELSGVSITFPHETYTEETTTTGWFSTGLSGISNELEPRVVALEEDVLELKNSGVSGTSEISVPSFWESAVNECIAKIKALQVGRDCVTFAFFSDNHQNTKFIGALIGKVMQDCSIPYCFFGGDAIDSGTLANESAMISNDKAFDDAMSIIDVQRMCRAVGNHDGYWVDSSGTKNRYTRSQIYDLFLRQESVAQNKHYGGDGTFYYVDDLASETRFVVCNTNYNVNTATETLDSSQIQWLNDVVFKDSDKHLKLVFISHQPITNNHHSNIYVDTAYAIQEILISNINAGWNVVGWFSGHIHADRIYQTDHSTNTEANDQSTVSLPWKTVTIRADHTGLCRDEDLIHAIADDNQSHAIDFVTINRATRTVNLTRLGIGEDRSYTY